MPNLILLFLPPANELREGNVFTGVSICPGAIRYLWSQVLSGGWYTWGRYWKGGKYTQGIGIPRGGGIWGLGVGILRG